MFSSLPTSLRSNDRHTSSVWRQTPVAVAILLMWVALICTGCASYTDRVHESQRAVVHGNTELAIQLLNEELEVEDLDGIPLDLDDEKALFLLERATLLQAMGNYKSASRDMMAIDDRLEWVDIQSGTADAILRFVYSDDVGMYRAPPHERLLLNTMNMINFMAGGEMSGARVEARRFDILQTYFLDDGSRDIMPDVLGLGNYLAATAFESARNYDAAARYYTLAHIYGTWPEPNDDRLLDLIALTGYRGSGLGELREFADPILKRASERTRIDRTTYRQKYQSGDTLFIVQTGLVPYRRARRVPLDRALAYSQRSPYHRAHLDSGQQEQALAIYAAGTVTWLNTTSLSRQGLPSRRTVTLSTGDQRLQLTDPIDLSSQVEQAWEIISATALAAGISRAVVRAAAGQATRAITTAVAEQSATISPFASIIGWISGMIMQGSLAAADTPDTRSWTSLPADIHLIRMQLPEGPQSIDLRVDNRRDTRDVDIRGEGFQLLNFSRLR